MSFFCFYKPHIKFFHIHRTCLKYCNMKLLIISLKFHVLLSSLSKSHNPLSRSRSLLGFFPYLNEMLPCNSKHLRNFFLHLTEDLIKLCRRHLSFCSNLFQYYFFFKINPGKVHLHLENCILFCSFFIPLIWTSPLVIHFLSKGPLHRKVHFQA